MTSKKKSKKEQHEAANTPIIQDDQDENSTTVASSSRKLTEQQQRMIIVELAKYHWSDIVRENLIELDPDFPALSARMISRYRSRIRSGEFDSWLTPLVAQHQFSPLTTRESRVRALVRQYRQLEKYDAPFVETPKGVMVNISEERRAILAQIAKEQGHDRAGAPNTTVNILNTHSGLPVNELDEAVIQAAESIMERIEAEFGMAAALVGSQHPDITYTAPEPKSL